MPISPGTRLGPYEILSPLGAGGMGEVYKARDTRLDRIVAIKVCAERFSERFESEAHTIAALNHPHICALHDVGPNYLVMEYIESETLAARNQERPTPAQRGAQDRHRSCGRAQRGALQGDRPSRPQARQHNDHRDGGKASRLRSR
jgi:serine/threonine protein kinase